MEASRTGGFAPGASILGGAAAGLSYEGALRDAVARDGMARRREDDRLRRVAPPQSQAAPRREAELAPMQAAAGGR